jgi:esterase/lipase superfamily enzyme
LLKIFFYERRVFQMVFSPILKREIEMLVGHSGYPVILFPHFDGKLP